MLSAEGCRHRRGRLWAELPPEVQWVLVADPRHVHWLSGFCVNPLSFSAGERGLLHLRRGGEATLLCDNFTLRSALGRPQVDRTIAEPWYDHRHGVPNRDHVLFRALEGIRGEMAPATGLLEEEWLPLGALAALGWRPEPARPAGPSLGSLLRSLRRCKDPDELELLRRAMRAGEAGHRRAREVVRPGASELEMYLAVQAAALGELGFPAPVYGDFRATRPELPKAGGPPTDYRLRAGDAFLCDFSVVVAGYRGDFTATLAAGRASEGLRELHALCLAALAAGEAALRPGAACREVYRAVAGVFAAGGPPGIFSHHAGHGLGLGHPEAPAFVPESEEVLLAGEVVTLEPGAYLEGVGGVRIEHNYRITAQGCERLTGHSLEL